MRKIVLTFGLLASAILVGIMSALVPLCMNGTLDVGVSEVFGYSSMVLSFLLVFFGVRSYRENVGGGTITFGKAFQVGILIVLVVCVVYSVAWLVMYYNFFPDFFDKYIVQYLEKMRTDGASDAAIAAKQAEMLKFKEWYKNPLINAAFTFLEPLPVGLVMALVSAAILRKKPATPPAGAPALA